MGKLSHTSIGLNSLFLCIIFLLTTSATRAQHAITQVTATLTTGVTTTRDSFIGAGYTAGTEGSVGDTVHYNFSNSTLAVNSVTANSQLWNVQAGGTLKLRRNSGGGNRTLGWYLENAARTGSVGNYTYSFYGQYQSNEESLLGGNNLLVGTDNIFVNNSTSPHHNTIERVDVLFPSGLTISSTLGFTVYDRGAVNAHDSVGIAGITALGTVNGDAQAPTNYGTKINLTSANYGTANLTADLTGAGGTLSLTQNYVIMRQNGTLATDDTGTADYLGGRSNQGIGGVLIPSTALGTAGSTIYGFSLFGGDTVGSGSGLADWLNTSAYPSSADAATATGLDLVGASSSYMQAVLPEPTPLALLLLGLPCLVRRRTRRAL